MGRAQLQRFILGFMLSFIALTTLSIETIPFDYPSWPWWVVLYYQVNDQLFRVHKQFFAIFALSFSVGLSMAINLNSRWLMVRNVVLTLIFAIWLLLIILFELQYQPLLDLFIEGPK